PIAAHSGFGVFFADTASRTQLSRPASGQTNTTSGSPDTALVCHKYSRRFPRGLYQERHRVERLGSCLQLFGKGRPARDKHTA
ncbi:MAG TPA: hypothetical protein V6D03_05240, partial [Candidatus Caenarcaniphilales bacterium]